MKRRNFLAGSATGLAASIGLGAPSVRAAGSAQVLKFVPQADLAILDPVFTTAFVTRNHAALVFDTLYGVDENFRPQPQMLEGHSIEDDGKLWKLTLREGLRFHDGTPVLARDVVASLKRWGSRDAFGLSFMERVAELSASSDRVVQFRLNRPFPLLPDALGKSGPSLACIMPERIAATESSRQITEMVGSGPYRFIANERVSGSRVVYEKFSGYRPREGGTPSFLAGPKIPHFDRIEWHVLPDASTAAAALQAGEVDWWEVPTTDLVPSLRRRRYLVVEVQETAGVGSVLRFNHLQPPFNNPAIRRAFLGAIRQEDFLASTAGDDRSMWTDKVGFFHPKSPMASDAGMEALTGPRDLDKAKRDLTAAGYKGERVVMLTASDHSMIDPLNQVAADLFRRLGVNVDLQAADWGTTFPRLLANKPVDQGGWSVHCNYTSGVGMMNPAAHTYLRGLGTRSLFGWPDSPRLEQLRNSWLDATDLATQQRICRDVQLQAFQDVPYIPLGLYYQPTAYKRELQGMLKGIPLFYNLRRG
jgi:peptide/nickel transport system substrate-binding protein